MNVGDTVLWDEPATGAIRSGTLIELSDRLLPRTATVLPFDAADLITLQATAVRTLEDEVRS
ncbi:hypothetical protein ACH9EU_05720 [Kocuria sp. M1R5S2]|uniref:hypothetical protein n=1 Tax=Kocuria rhizosphaerae TaxID=3376285 RepID=UPI00378CB44D